MRITVKAKLAGAFGILVVLFAGTAAFSILSLGKLNTSDRKSVV